MENQTQTTDLSAIRAGVELELTKAENVALLIQTTFKGLQPEVMKRAMMEGIMRGFTFKDFLEKNIYAIPFKDGYSLVTSIDHARKIGMRSGVVGKSAPVYTEKEGKIVSCEITIKRKCANEIGEFTSLVFFDEYYKEGSKWDGKYKPSMWDLKPHTMIAKVAEMHALRMACPEEMSQMYAEEEIIQDITPKVIKDMGSYETKVRAVKDIDELQRVWALLPIEAKLELGRVKDEVKAKFMPVVAAVEQPQASPVPPMVTKITPKEAGEAADAIGHILDKDLAEPMFVDKKPKAVEMIKEYKKAADSKSTQQELEDLLQVAESDERLDSPARKNAVKGVIQGRLNDLLSLPTITRD